MDVIFSYGVWHMTLYTQLDSFVTLKTFPSSNQLHSNITLFQMRVTSITKHSRKNFRIRTPTMGIIETMKYQNGRLYTYHCCSAFRTCLIDARHTWLVRLGVSAVRASARLNRTKTLSSAASSHAAPSSASWTHLHHFFRSSSLFLISSI
jgi:hypothetical protein